MKAGRRSGARCRAGFEPLSLFPHSREIVWNVHSFQHNEMHCSYVTSLSFPTAVYKRKTNNSACWDGSSCSHSAVSAGQAFSAPLLFPLHSVLLHTFGSSVNLQILRVFFPQLPWSVQKDSPRSALNPLIHWVGILIFCFLACFSLSCYRTAKFSVLCLAFGFSSLKRFPFPEKLW